MSTLDQFETESTSFYSGSYTGQVVFGDRGVEGFNDNANQRKIATSKINGTGEAYFAQAYAPYWIVDGYVTGSFAGRAQRFNRFLSGDEFFFDSIVPNPIDIHFRSATDMGWYAGGLTVSGGERWNIHSVEASTTTPGGGGLFHVWAMEPGNVASFLPDAAIDHEWYLRQPFESKYKGIERLIFFTGRYAEKYTATTEVFAGSTMTPASSSNLIAGCGLGVVGAAAYVIALGWIRRPGDQYPRRAVTDAVGSVPPKVYFELFYGIGDGDPYGVYRKGPSYLGFLSAVIFARKALLRGWKYGLMSTTPTNTACVFRQNRFGQFRDMLEQRKYSKFLDVSKGQTTTRGAVEIRFVSGTTTFARSVDYVTATNPDYNLRDSGIYDFEYRSGQPYFEG